MAEARTPSPPPQMGVPVLGQTKPPAAPSDPLSGINSGYRRTDQMSDATYPVPQGQQGGSGGQTVQTTVDQGVPQAPGTDYGQEASHGSDPASRSGNSSTSRSY